MSWVHIWPTGPLGDPEHGMQVRVSLRTWMAAAAMAPSLDDLTGTCGEQPELDVTAAPGHSEGALF